MFKSSYLVFKNPTNSVRLIYKNLFRHFSLIKSSDSDFTRPHKLISFKHCISVNVMTKSDLALALQWAQTEGWCPGLYELEALYAADPDGYYILRLDGEPIASLACVRHNDNYAFLGLFIVLPQFRNQGYGRILWDVVLGRAAIVNSLGLNAVMQQIHRYKKSGFLEDSLISRWRVDTAKLSREHGSFKEKITLSDTVSHQKVLDYDAAFFVNSRKSFLKKWLEMPESRTLTAINKAGDPVGYASVSRTSEGYKIAPFIANDASVADSLYRGLTHFVGDHKRVFIDMPYANPETKKLAERFKMEKISDTMRMYAGKKTEEDLKRVIGVTSLEIGY